MIRQRWPSVAARLEHEAPHQLDAEVIEGHDQTLRIRGIQLTSRHDRLAEARYQAASLPTAAPELHVYGTGLGDLQRILLQAPTLQRLHVHVLNGAVFALALGALDQLDWLGDPRVGLAYAGDTAEISLPFFALPSELALADDQAAKIRDRLVSEVHLGFNNRIFEADDPAVIARLQSNELLLAQDGDVAQLFGSAPGAHVYIVATGPTLERHYDHLRLSQATAERPLIICVDTAYRPLLDHGIVADVVIAIDRHIRERHLPGEQSAGIPLVYLPMVAPQVLQQWHGPRLAAYSASPAYAPYRQRLPKGLLHSGGSVIHPAVDLAVRMGAVRVTLFGADFAFPYEKTHAGWDDGEFGSPARLARYWVGDGHGGRVRTQLNLRGYLTELERYIAQHPEVAFFNSSRDGAFIAGTTFAEGLAHG
ncbi:6-hydroxymethylpterin diphosphokinase MptE-like protein [Pseudomonas sp. RIT-PI-S]|uniref:motility associated factor glycosyltransferase family protein n=1 Tax=Pseudomonas sp. RIT-PI-S TaxID=3035295 RepID=UPI0021DB07BA|nr:6-hydroxymethylpterin diphosphokinase MptE-like protein [Pseudomonas sp. RIT-PI-S]